jgi:hypothetical protein
MKEVIGNMCEHCNTIYLSEEETKICEEICLLKNKLKKASILAKKSYKQKLLNDYCASKRFIVDKPRKQATNINHLMELLKDYFYKFYGIELSYIGVSNLKWVERISNTHCSPVNGETNWLRKPGLPFYYSGYMGRLKYKFDYPKMEAFWKEFPKLEESNPITVFEGINIINGDLILFDDDLPLLKI